MKIKKLIVGTFAVAAFFISCKKEEDNTSSASIQGKWNMSKFYFESKENGVLDSATIPSASGDYVDFRADGKSYSRYTNPFTNEVELDTIAFSLLGSNKLIFTDDSGSDTFNIYELTTKSLVFGGYDEFDDNDNYSLFKSYCVR